MTNGRKYVLETTVEMSQTAGPLFFLNPHCTEIMILFIAWKRSTRVKSATNPQNDTTLVIGRLTNFLPIIALVLFCTFQDGSAHKIVKSACNTNSIRNSRSSVGICTCFLSNTSKTSVYIVISDNLAAQFHYECCWVVKTV